MSRQLHERVLCQIAGRSLVEKFLALRGTEASAEGVRAESAKRTFMQTLRRAESRAEENERRLDNHIQETNTNLLESAFRAWRTAE